MSLYTCHSVTCHSVHVTLCVSLYNVTVYMSPYTCHSIHVTLIRESCQAHTHTLHKAETDGIGFKHSHSKIIKKTSANTWSCQAQLIRNNSNLFKDALGLKCLSPNRCKQLQQPTANSHQCRDNGDVATRYESPQSVRLLLPWLVSQPPSQLAS